MIFKNFPRHRLMNLAAQISIGMSIRNNNWVTPDVHLTWVALGPFSTVLQSEYMMSHCHSPGPHWWYSDLLFSCPSKSSYMILTPSWNSRQDLKFLIVFKYLRVHATAANTAQHSLPARINSLNIKPALAALSFYFKIYYVTLDV